MLMCASGGMTGFPVINPPAVSPTDANTVLGAHQAIDCPLKPKRPQFHGLYQALLIPGRQALFISDISPRQS